MRHRRPTDRHTCTNAITARYDRRLRPRVGRTDQRTDRDYRPRPAPTSTGQPAAYSPSSAATSSPAGTPGNLTTVPPAPSDTPNSSAVAAPGQRSRPTSTRTSTRRADHPTCRGDVRHGPACRPSGHQQGHGSGKPVMT